jgi:hypothetical protein
VVYENPAHHLRRQRKKMRAAPPVDFSLADESQIRFVHKRRRLERVVFAIATQLARGALPEFLVDERQQLFLRFPIARRPQAEQTCHRAG